MTTCILLWRDRDRYDESDGKQGQTNCWVVDIVIDHVMPYLQYSSLASKERMEAAALQSGMSAKDIAEIPLAE